VAVGEIASFAYCMVVCPCVEAAACEIVVWIEANYWEVEPSVMPDDNRNVVAEQFGAEAKGIKAQKHYERYECPSVRFESSYALGCDWIDAKHQCSPNVILTLLRKINI